MNEIELTDEPYILKDDDYVATSDGVWICWGGKTEDNGGALRWLNAEQAARVKAEERVQELERGLEACCEAGAEGENVTIEIAATLCETSDRMSDGAYYETAKLTAFAAYLAQGWSEDTSMQKASVAADALLAERVRPEPEK